MEMLQPLELVEAKNRANVRVNVGLLVTKRPETQLKTNVKTWVLGLIPLYCISAQEGQINSGVSQVF